MPDENGAESSAAGADSHGLPHTRLSSSTGAFRRPSSPSTRAEHDEEAIEEIKRYESFSTVDWLVDGSRERARITRARARRFQAAGGGPSILSAPNGNRTGFSQEADDPDANATNASPSTAAQIRARLAMHDPSSRGSWGKFGFAPGERPPRWWPMGSFWGRKAWWAWRFAVATAAAAADSGVVILVGIFIGINMAVISIATEWASDLKQGYCKQGWWLNEKFCCWEMMEPAGPGGSTPLARPVSSAAPSFASTIANSSSTAALLSRGLGAAAWAHSSLLMPRADRIASGTGDLSETCTDWVPWSTWTFPAWLIYVFTAGALSTACAWLVKAFAPYAAGSGISEIKCILAGFIINGYLGVWTFVIKSLTLPLAIASGLSVGKEGPAVHVACCIGHLVSQFFREIKRSQAKMRELLTASSAAGVAVAFGSPIGGVLFSLEEMAYNFPATTMWRSFLCALAATVTLSFMNPFRTGKLVLFQVSYDRDWHYFETVFYIIIGVFGGLYGALVIRYNLQVQNFRRNHLAAHGVSEVVVLAVITASVAYFNKFLRIDMTESLEILFRECEGGGDYDNLCQSSAQWRMVNSLLLATIIRFALVIVSYGCKVPAGIFVPSMAIGATFGRMIGILVKALHSAMPNASFFSACHPDVPCITPGTYAFLGAAAALAGVTRITVAVVVIMFELTGALTYILPTMIVVMVTKGIGDWYGRGGIAEQMIRFNGYPFLDKDEHAFGIPVQDVMKKSPARLYSSGLSLAEVEAKLSQGEFKGFPLVASREDLTLLGYVGKTELRYAIAKAKRVRTLTAKTQCTFSCSPETAIETHPEMLITPLLPAFGDDAPVTPRRATARDLEGEGLIEREGKEDEDEEQAEDSEAVEEGHGEGSADVLELGGWVDQTPLSVPPAMALEVVMDLFKKMGPRVIIVTKYGKLAGLVTVKDVLKYIAAQERTEAELMKAQAEREEDELPYSHPHSDGEAEGVGELEALLTDALEYVEEVWYSIKRKLPLSSSARARPPARPPRGRGRHVVFDQQDADAAYDTSLEDIGERRSRGANPSGPRQERTSEQEQFVLGDD